MRLDVVFHFDQSSLTELKALLHTVIAKEDLMAGELTLLQQEVAETKTVIDSAIVLIQGLKAALDAAIASGDPAALTALSAELDAKQAELAAAITAGTPTP
jgi:hypothetical protein